MTRHVVIWTGSDDAWLRAALADVDGLRCSVPGDRAAALAAMADADALITLVQTWGEDCAAALRASRISWLQVLNAGIDPLQRWGLPSNVAVSTLGGAGSASIAEHALFLLLALLRQAPALLAKQRHSEWTTRPMAEAIESLQEKRIAVLGAGHIGRKIAALTMAFGAKPIAVARSARCDPLGFEVVPLTEFGDVLASCAAAVVALPLEATTNRLLDAAALARLPRGAYLVNISRGSIVDTDALVAALKKGALAGAALDVTDPEPLPPNHPLWSLPNVIITPHVAWAGASAKKRREIEATVVENVRRFVRGESPLNLAVTAMWP